MTGWAIVTRSTAPGNGGQGVCIQNGQGALRAPPRGAMRLRVASLNAWALPDPVGRDVPKRMRALGRHLPQLEIDVLSLQEVWTPEARATLVVNF